MSENWTPLYSRLHSASFFYPLPPQAFQDMLQMHSPQQHALSRMVYLWRYTLTTEQVNLVVSHMPSGKPECFDMHSFFNLSLWSLKLLQSPHSSFVSPHSLSWLTYWDCSVFLVLVLPWYWLSLRCRCINTTTNWNPSISFNQLWFLKQCGCTMT